MSPTAIKQLRASLGISQRSLADLLGRSTVTVNRWERGKAEPRDSMVLLLREMSWWVEEGCADELLQAMRAARGARDAASMTRYLQRLCEES